MSFYVLLISSIFIFSIETKAFAKEEVKPLTLKSAVNTALSLNPKIKMAREKVQQYESLVGLTRSVLFPAINFSASAGSAQAALNSGNPPLFNGTTYNSYNSTLSLTQPLFAYGALDAVSASDYDRQLKVNDLEIAERTLTTNVISSFYNIILNERLLTNLNKSKEMLAKALETTQHRERIGRAQVLDVLQVKTQIASIQPQIENARNSYETAAAQLASYMGITGQKTELSIKGQLKTLLMKDLEKKINYKNYHLPELEANRLLLEQIGNAKNVNSGKYLPTLKLSGNYIFNSYVASDLFSSNANSWNAAVVLTIPIFEGLASRYDSSNFAAQESQLYSTRLDLENTLSLNQVTSRKTLETVEISLVSATETNKLAQESLTEATRQYKLATIDFLQYLTIQTAAITASSSLDQIRYNGITASANYFVASGQPLSILIDMLSEGE